MSNKKVLIVGPIAPPFGGVSVHILRLTQLLISKFDFDFVDESRTKKKEYFNLRSLKFLQYFKKIKEADLIYINSGKTSLRIFHLFSGKLFGKKMILTIHSFSKNSKAVNKLICKIYNQADKIILVNENLKMNLILPETKYVFKEAFIPPIIEYESDLPSYISEWIDEKKEKENYIICANASSLDTFNNQDLYGIDLCISVCERLKKKKLSASFIFIVSSHKNEETFLKYKKLIEDLKLCNDFFLVNENLSFVRVIERSDLVLRSTNTDGDALTVREGLFFKKPVLASDAVKRPDSVFLFKNRNIDDLELKLENLICQKKEKEIPNNYSIQTNEVSQFYLDLIENILGK